MARGGATRHIVVVDPPFQPELVPAIWRCAREVLLGSEVFAKVDVLFAFPYFSREALVGSEDSPKLVMNDYRVDYANHRTYKADKSPVRFFTRFHELTDLPAASYRVCEKCGGRWVHKANAHCDTCRACTTLHGNKAWSHCAACGKCTKPELKHCEKCERDRGAADIVLGRMAGLCSRMVGVCVLLLQAST
ncbi:rRNA N6-adenosine-methyltransferase zcchc4, partial [Perkinsus olseni]